MTDRDGARPIGAAGAGRRLPRLVAGRAAWAPAAALARGRASGATPCSCSSSGRSRGSTSGAAGAWNRSGASWCRMRTAEAAPPQLEPRLRRALARHKDATLLVLGEDDALTCTDLLPAAAEGDLARIMGHKLDLLTPWSAEQGYAAQKVLGRRRDGMLEVLVAAASRPRLDELLRGLAARGREAGRRRRGAGGRRAAHGRGRPAAQQHARSAAAPGCWRILFVHPAARRRGQRRPGRLADLSAAAAAGGADAAGRGARAASGRPARTARADRRPARAGPLPRRRSQQPAVAAPGARGAEPPAAGHGLADRDHARRQRAVDLRPRRGCLDPGAAGRGGAGVRAGPLPGAEHAGDRAQRRRRRAPGRAVRACGR